MNLNLEISKLKGVGPKTAEVLNRCGIYTILDLLLYLPRDYEFINNEFSLEDFIDTEKYSIKCKFVSVKSSLRVKNGKTLTTLIFNNGKYEIHGKWFNQPYIKNNFKKDEEVFLLGKVKVVNARIEMINPIISKNLLQEREIIAKYSLRDAITNKMISKLVHLILDTIKIKENLPLSLVEKYNLISLDSAIRYIHFPKDSDSLKKAMNRLKFQELFTYSLKLLTIKEHLRNEKQGINFVMTKELSMFKECLPFQLTGAQNRTVREILIDQKRSYPMNRLVQGDVGSGKTIVAFIAAFNVYFNGYQVAFMAPTEILAEQHYNEAIKLFEKFNVKVHLLTGSTKTSKKNLIKEELQKGEPAVVIGTHALIEDNVVFSKLGLVITDEQHRFGVNQRGKLINKNQAADVLVMSATPIPRTLALYLYNDLDISIIDELPPGRKKIETEYYTSSNRQQAYTKALDEIRRGRQVYIVCPLIEENDKLDLKSINTLYEELKNTYFSRFSMAILHGKMNSKEKEEIMKKFKDGNIDVLLATTVIEVGVNVPNASIMIIENAERFGLSQLHQLRGRVGRGQYQSYCILIAKAENNITRKRMEIMTKSNDGFFIAEQDMKLRGTGMIFGTKQHGDTGFMIADVLRDGNILRAANMEASLVYSSNREEDILIKGEIIKQIEVSEKYICFN
ncbi:MAG: ATP-dependent DNA helicase RecG [Clostridiaceae bacterium]